MAVQTRSFYPPVSGWIAAENALKPPKDGAWVLDNFFPTASGARVRGGKRLHATLDDEPVRMFTYLSGDNATLFASTETDIFDITAPADAEVTPTAWLGSQTSGDWSDVQISTAGGDFLVCVNGADSGFVWDGSTIEQYGGGTYSITGVTSSNLTHVGLFGSRLFFCEKNSMNVWYLPVDSIAGTATKFPLGSVFNRSSKVLFTGTWSLSAGDGLQDLFFAVSEEGEVAIYEGYDPAVWSIVGVYEIGRPIDKHAWTKVGADVLIMTTVGLVPLSQAITKDLAQLSEGTASLNIEDAWRDAITNRSGSRATPIIYWKGESLLLIGTEATATGGNVSFVLNPRTKAWSRYIGWDVICGAVSEDNLYFAEEDGLVYQGEVTGSDAGTAYQAHYVPMFSTCDVPNIKHVQQVNAVFRGSVSVNWGANVNADFTVPDPSPNLALPEPSTAALWGSFTWGSFTWGGGSRRETTSTWKNVRGKGFAVAPSILLTSNSTAAPEVEVMATQIRYEVGSVL